jgi:hypothetical protein
MAVTQATPDELEALRKFNLWFKRPYELVRNSGNGHGAFVALSIGLFLTERYFRDETGTIDNHRSGAFKVPAAAFFQTEQAFFDAFWDVYRNGMQHQGSPKATTPHGWDINGDYRSPNPMKATHRGREIICLNPWMFTDKIISLWENNLGVIARTSSHQLGNTSTQAFAALPVVPLA